MSDIIPCCTNCRHMKINHEHNDDYWCYQENRKISFLERHGYYDDDYECELFELNPTPVGDYMRKMR